MFALDRCARLHVAGTRAGSYFVCGVAGVVTGLLLVTLLAPYGSASAIAVVVGVVAALIGFIVAIKIFHILFGYERIVYYEMLAAVLACVAGAMLLVGEPVWPTAELLTLGLGAFLPWGRIGCLRVGCCHGRPWSGGIRYGGEHVAAGFTPYYENVRLFPIQLVDAVNGVAATCVATWTFLRPHGRAEVLIAYLVAYGLGRFFIELARGDDDRPYLVGLSEAQWFALGSHWTAAALVLSGRLHGAYYLPIAAVTTAAAAVVAVWWIAGGPNGVLRLRAPLLTAELYRALGELRRAADEIAVVDTPSGLRLSFREGEDGDHVAIHLALSRPGAPLSERAASRLAGQLSMLLGIEDPEALIPGRDGIHHLRGRVRSRAGGGEVS